MWYTTLFLSADGSTDRRTIFGKINSQQKNLSTSEPVGCNGYPGSK